MKYYLLLIAVVFTSCTHYYYAPTTANIPMLKEKDELRINANYYLTDEAAGGELQAAYAVTNKTAVMFNLLSASADGKLFRSDKGYDNVPDGFGTYGELGYGYYYPDPKSKWVFETYGGIGVGSVTNRYTQNEKSRVRITKLFVQPSFGWRSNYFEIAFSSRFAYARLKVKENAGFPDPDVEYIRSHPSAFIVEPAMLIRFGFKHTKISMNYTHSANLSHNWKQENTGISVGLSFPVVIEK